MWDLAEGIESGLHWIYINGNRRDGPLASTCEDWTAKHRTVYTTPVRVVLTVEKDNSNLRGR
jgi:hypothetical protein